MPDPFIADENFGAHSGHTLLRLSVTGDFYPFYCVTCDEDVAIQIVPYTLMGKVDCVCTKCGESNRRWEAHRPGLCVDCLDEKAMAR